MPPAWNTLPDEEDARLAMDLEDEISTSSSSNSNRSARSRSLTLSLPAPAAARASRRPRMKRPSVPALSATSLFNRLQTSSVVVIDCRSAGDFAAAHIHCALLCENGRTGVGHSLKTVDDVIAARHNDALARKLADRDMLEVVVIGSNRPKSALLRRMDGGYRFRQDAAARGTRVLEDPAPATPPVLQYPNEIVDDFLFLGNFWQADNAQIVRDLKITHIINMGAITETRQAV
ncbi:hypothetical protein PINS_up019604 [Pythium insidiosum]|nr:hypothetical protein PINS_up019604 [Pythium insidiosum]